MEKCTIFCTQNHYYTLLGILHDQLPGYKLVVNKNAAETTINASVGTGVFSKKPTLKLVYSDLPPGGNVESKELILNHRLSQLDDFLQGIPARNESLRRKLSRLIPSFAVEINVEVSPFMSDQFAQILMKITRELQGVIYAEPSRFFQKSNNVHFLNHELELILDTVGNSAVNGIDHVKPSVQKCFDKKERKERSERSLILDEVPVDTTLAELPSSAEIDLRSSSDILNRCYGLLAVVVKSEGIEDAPLAAFIAEKQIQHLSPLELQFIQTTDIDPKSLIQHRWRYESLNTLLWVIDKVDQLSFPSEKCKFDEILELISAPDKEVFSSNINLKSKGEILDELDRTFRMFDACTKVENGIKFPANLNPSVLYERLYALTWCIQHLEKDWDDVSLKY